MTPQYSIYEIASFFLDKEAIPLEKLQILCYYAEAWSQALLKKGLVNDTIFEAWAKRPVSPELYENHPSHLKTNFEEKDKTLLERVWVTYGSLSTNELAAIVRQETPWIKARNERLNHVISRKDMADFYCKQYMNI